MTVGCFTGSGQISGRYVLIGLDCLSAQCPEVLPCFNFILQTISLCLFLRQLYSIWLLICRRLGPKCLRL